MNVLRTPLTALAVKVKFNQNGRHVGLDFYDLLKEAGHPTGTVLLTLSRLLRTDSAKTAPAIVPGPVAISDDR